MRICSRDRAIVTIAVFTDVYVQVCAVCSCFRSDRDSIAIYSLREFLLAHGDMLRIDGDASNLTCYEDEHGQHYHLQSSPGAACLAPEADEIQVCGSGYNNM